ncbi:MAG: tyrosine-protein phosphatase, partial [Stackebrandtia sp.]
MTPELHIALQGSPNTRDLGGYETWDGMQTRFGMLYRSGELSKLTEEDATVLTGLGLRTVVDFRLPEEVAFGGPDRLPEGLAPVSLPVGGGGLDGFYALAKSGDWDLVRRELGDGKGEESMA